MIATSEYMAKLCSLYGLSDGAREAGFDAFEDWYDSHKDADLGEGTKLSDYDVWSAVGLFDDDLKEYNYGKPKGEAAKDSTPPDFVPYGKWLEEKTRADGWMRQEREWRSECEAVRFLLSRCLPFLKCEKRKDDAEVKCDVFTEGWRTEPNNCVHSGRCLYENVYAYLNRDKFRDAAEKRDAVRKSAMANAGKAEGRFFVCNAMSSCLLSRVNEGRIRGIERTYELADAMSFATAKEAHDYLIAAKFPSAEGICQLKGGKLVVSDAFMPIEWQKPDDVKKYGVRGAFSRTQSPFDIIGHDW